MSNGNVKFSVVSPVYMAENIVGELVQQLHKALSIITDNYEIILVNDDSPDCSWEKICTECDKDHRVKGISLSRNFGQHYAITAGLNYAKGLWIVVMDCDLQDRPDEIPSLYTKALEGWDIVYAKRTDRKDTIVKRYRSLLFFKVYRYLSGIKTDHRIANFGLYNQKAINAFLQMKEYARSFPSLINYVGFKSCSIDVMHANRYEGKTSYSLKHLLNLSGDVVLSNSNKPLKLAVKLGFFISFTSFIIAFYNIIAHYIGINKVPGFTSTIFSIWFVGGLILLMLGIVGLYIGKVFNQVKDRQLYIINERKNL
jgi:polyisoprenyl-phosphate glycosyltransferase